MLVNLRKLSPGKAEYEMYSEKFMHEWRDTKKTAQIQSIHIAPRRALQGSGRGKRFKKYVDQWDGRSRTTFHGTQRACHVGEDPKHSSLLLCHKDDCCLCSILRKSFRVDKAGPGGMFGPGIYSSQYSSKADRYARNHRIKSNLHAMIICQVAYNNPQPMYQEETSRWKPDHGFDCVEGIPQKHGGSLLNPEIVVYRDDAIIPIGVIMYTREGWDGDVYRPVPYGGMRVPNGGRPVPNKNSPVGPATVLHKQRRLKPSRKRRNWFRALFD